MADEMLALARELREKIDALVPELDRLRSELRTMVLQLRESGVDIAEIAAATGIDAAKVRRWGPASDLVSCSFCGRDQQSVAQLVAGPGVYICNDCVDGAMPAPPAKDDHDLCSFCGKGPHHVELVERSADRRFRICDECLELCRSILEEGIGGSRP